MAFSITSDMITIDDAADITNWSSDVTHVQDTENYIEGAASVGLVKVSEAIVRTKFDYYTENGSTYYNASTNPTHLFCWVNVANGGGLAELDSGTESTSGGVRIYMEDLSGNYVEWYVAGNDTYGGGWRCFVAYTDATADNSSGTIDKTQIRYFGVTLNMEAKTTANVNNAWVDIMRYGSGLVASGTDVSAMTWQDIYDGDVAGPYGVIRKSAGVYLLQGALTIGDNVGTASTTFEDNSQIIVFEDAKVSAVLYNVTLVGNSTGTTSIKFGSKSGTRGISGCVFKAEGTKKYDFTATNQYLNTLGIYGCSFIDADIVSLPTYSTTREMLSCNIEASGEVKVSTCTVKYCNFIDADDNGAEITDVNHGITYANFINCPDGVEITVSGTTVFNNMQFAGCAYDIEYSATSGWLTINAEESNPSTYHVTSGGGGVTINNAVPVSIHVITTAGEDILNAQTAIYNISGYTQLMNEDTDVDGLAGYSHNYVGDTDIEIRVRKSSVGDTRYYPFKGTGTIDDNGFTLNVRLTEDVIVT